MNSLILFLQSIPNVIWSGVVASLLTFGGMVLSNRDSTRRLMLQLQHDAAEKTKERIATLRRDVYLRTVEELVKANAHLAGLPQKDLSKENPGDGLQGFFSAAARLQLVAEPGTALLIAKLQAEYGELFLELMIHLIPAGNAKSDIQIADDLYTKAQAEVTRILAEMVRQNESGKPDQNVFQSLRSSFEFQQAQSSEYAEARSQAWQNFTACNISFQRFLFTKIRDLGQKNIPVLIAIRRDLGLNDNLIEFENEMKIQSQRIEARFNELIENLDVKT